MSSLMRVWRVWRTLPAPAREAALRLIAAIPRGEVAKAFAELERALIECGYTRAAEELADQILKRMR